MIKHGGIVGKVGVIPVQHLVPNPTRARSPCCGMLQQVEAPPSLPQLVTHTLVGSVQSVNQVHHVTVKKRRPFRYLLYVCDHVPRLLNRKVSKRWLCKNKKVSA